MTDDYIANYFNQETPKKLVFNTNKNKEQKNGNPNVFNPSEVNKNTKKGY